MRDIPAHPRALAKLLRRIEKRAAQLADEQDRRTYESRPEAIREAVDAAVSHLYFYGGSTDSKAEAALTKIVVLLAPEIGRALDDGGSRLAYRVLHPDDEA